MLSSLYPEQGYLLLRQFFCAEELDAVESTVRLFHSDWLAANHQDYQSGAVNSAYLTGRVVLDVEQRRCLLRFVSCDKLVNLVDEIIPGSPAFMNTQLFFNPANPAQKNYWHRDVQYTGLPVVEQQKVLRQSTVLHCRIPLAAEPGLELVPGSHMHWDNELEQEVRLERCGRRCCDELPGGLAMPLERGDLLVFSANMLHRGLYGMQRCAFDVIYCDADPDLLRHADVDCLPDAEDMTALGSPAVFSTTLDLLAPFSDQ